jgi:hypothetical protein
MSLMTGPPYLEDGYFTVGGVQFPLTASLSNTLLFDADPVLYRMVEYYQGIMNLHIEPRWNAAVSVTGLSGLDGYMPNEVLPYPPFRSGLSQQNAWRFPLLAVYPKGESSYKFETVTWFTVMREFELLFVLPPLTSDQYEQLFPFLGAVEKTIVDRTLQGFDTNFNNGELVWQESGLEKISLVSSFINDIVFESALNTRFPTLTMQLMVQERRMPDVRNYETFTGVDLVVDGYGPIDGYGPPLGGTSIAIVDIDLSNT